MCRLYGFVSAHSATVTDTLGQIGVSEFAELSRLHANGWGAAWVEAGTPAATATNPAWDRGVDLARVRSTRPAADDPVFARLASTQATTAGIVHLRWASPGMATTVANTHPFAVFADGPDAAGTEIAFAHNGYVPWSDELTAAGDRQWAAAGCESPALIGVTDSERYFWLIRAFHAASADWPAAVARAVATIRELAGGVCLNAMAVTSSHLIVVRAAAGLLPDFGPRIAAGLIRPPLPRDHEVNYHVMRTRRTATAVQFVSSGLSDPSWEEIPDESMTVVDRATLTVSTSQLGTY